MTRPTSSRIRLSGLHYAKLLRLLYEQGGTCSQLAAETGFSDDTVRAYIRELRRQKLLYVQDYPPDAYNRRSTPSYRFGPDMADAAQPPPLTHAQRQRNYMQRQLMKRMYFRPSTSENQ